MKLTNFRKTAKRILAGVVTAGVIFAMAMPAFAAPGITYTGVAGGSVTINKYLVLRQLAEVPNYTFNYSIAAGAAVASTGNGGTTQLEVYAGNDANKVTGTPTIGTAVFAQGQTTYTSAQTLVSAGIQVPPTATDPVTLDPDEKYAKSPITVSFTGVTFKEPGIYRYIITETATTSDSFITDDTDLTRTMDVYVIDNNGTLEIQGYVLHDDQTVVSKDGTTLTNDDKAYGYVNKYNTADLSIQKVVSGNEASHDEYFEITVAISGALPSTVYNVDLTGCDATTKLNGINTTTHTNPTTITTDASGAATATFWLQNTQVAIIRGIGYTTNYSITENKTTMDAEGYAVTITNDDDDASTNNANFTTSGIIDDGEASDDLATTILNNNRSGVLPTGVVVYIGGGIALCGGAAAMIILMMYKKRRDSKANS